MVMYDIILMSVGDSYRDTYLYKNKQKYTSKISSHFISLLTKEFLEKQSANV